MSSSMRAPIPKLGRVTPLGAHRRRHDFHPGQLHTALKAERRRSESLLLQERARLELAWQNFKPQVGQGVEPAETLTQFDVRTSVPLAELLAKHATARILSRLDRPRRERFVIVYGDESDATREDGRGPFRTIKQATLWFLQGGR